MRTLIPFLFGAFVAWTSAAIYIACHEDEHLSKLQDERALRIQAQRDAEHAQGRELRARVELDTIRREWMKTRIEWHRIPAAVADADGDRIPATNLPTR